MVLSCLRTKSIQYLLVLCAKSCEVRSRAPYCCCCLKHLPGLAALPKSRSAKSCASVAPLEDPEARGAEHLSLQVTFGDSRDYSSSHNATSSPTPLPNQAPQPFVCVHSPQGHLLSARRKTDHLPQHWWWRAMLQTFSAGLGLGGEGRRWPQGLLCQKASSLHSVPLLIFPVCLNFCP